MSEQISRRLEPFGRVAVGDIITKGDTHYVVLALHDDTHTADLVEASQGYVDYQRHCAAEFWGSGG